MLQEISDADFVVNIDSETFPICLRAVASHRHIGIDQGRRNFAVVAVDKRIGEKPLVITAENYDLDLPERFAAADVLVKLLNETNLMSLMQQTDDRLFPSVDRVVVHLEQMSPENRNWKQFGIELGQLLQRSVTDVDKCVVKLSSPHLFRPGGVIDHLGRDIVDELSLVPVPCNRRHSTGLKTPVPAKVRRRTTDNEDVEPSSSNEDDESNLSDENADYRHRKKMSANIFRFVSCRTVYTVHVCR